MYWYGEEGRIGNHDIDVINRGGSARERAVDESLAYRRGTGSWAVGNIENDITTLGRLFAPIAGSSIALFTN
jgi:hypothetical protein